MEHEGEPHAQVGGDARRHGQHHGVARGPRGRWIGVPVLRRASGGVQAVERGRAHDAQAVVVVPAVRDHLGGLTSGEARGRSGVRPALAAALPQQSGQAAGRNHDHLVNPSGGRRRAGPVGRTRLSVRPAGWPPSGSARGAAWRLASCRNAWIPVDQVVDPRSEPLAPAAVALPGVTPVTLGSSRRVLASARRPADPARPGSPASRLLALGRHHRSLGATLHPDPGVNNPLTRYAPVCGLDCPAHRRSLTPCERTGGGCDSSLQATGTNRPPRARPSGSTPRPP